MIPIDFFKTANLLKSETDEAHIRTSIGRSYYGLFLYFREHLAKLGLKKNIQPKNEVHSFVINCLRFGEIKEGSILAEVLSNLQQLRHDADYVLGVNIISTQAIDALDDARQAIADYNLISTSDEQKLIVKAKQHAKLKCWVN